MDSHEASPGQPRQPGVLARTPLSSTKSINIGRLAGAIAARLRQDEGCEINAVGPDSHHCAVKAIVMAQEWFDRDGEFPGTRFAIHASSVALPAVGGLAPSKLCQLRLQPVARACPAEHDVPDLFVGGDGNPGLLAGDLTARLRSSPSVEMSSMGPSATSRALKALILANKYVKTSGEGREEQVVLALVRAELIDLRQGTRTRFRWTCIQDPPGEAQGA